MTQTMRAVVLDGPGPPEALVIRDLPVPDPAAGWVLIRVRAFGLNRRFDEIVEAHRAMEGDQVSGKLVVTT